MEELKKINSEQNSIFVSNVNKILKDRSISHET